MQKPETTTAELLAGAAADLRALLEQVAEEAAPTVERMTDGCARALGLGNKVLFAGNGGSAAECQHLATELACRFTTDRIPYAAIALTTDTSFLTACANDYGFEEVFARQVEALGRPGDVLIVLSTSGGSPNVLRAVAAAREGRLTAYGLTGRNGQALARVCDEAILVPHGDPARIQEAHLFLGHLLCGGIESRLGGFRGLADHPANRSDD
jgi:D-sedoheptulose 7-phosphate isomerase